MNISKTDRNYNTSNQIRESDISMIAGVILLSLLPGRCNEK
ncbi:MAG: hypothetical protein ACRCVW_00435 [Brevinema sp.]